MGSLLAFGVYIKLLHSILESVSIEGKVCSAPVIKSHYLNLMFVTTS